MSFATSFFPAFKDQQEDLSGEQALDSYMDIIGNAIDQGFAEAMQILDALNVLQGDIAENIDKVYNFVQDGLNAFETQTLELV